MRPLAAFVLLLVGALMVPLATAGWWLRDTVVPTGAYVETVAPLASDDDVQRAVGQRLVAVTTSSLDQVPAPLREPLEGLIRRAVRAVVQSPAFAEAWRGSNRAAHRQLTAALAGDSDAMVDGPGSTVVLRLAPLVDAVRDEVADAGFGGDLVLDEVIPRTDMAYPVGDVEDLGRARTAYSLLEDYGRVLPLVAGLLLVLGLVAARRRAPALAWTALLALLGLGLLWLGLGVGRSAYVDALSGEALQEAGRAYYDVVTADLRGLLLAVAAASGVALVVSLAAALARRD